MLINTSKRHKFKKLVLEKILVFVCFITTKEACVQENIFLNTMLYIIANAKKTLLKVGGNLGFFLIS